MEFKPPHQNEMSLLLQMRVWLPRCGADTAWWYQPNGDGLQGWPVMGFWELSSCFSVFYLRVCWDQVKLSSWVNCLAFYSGLFVSASDRDKTGKVSAASASRLHGSCSIKNSENTLRSCLTLKSATAFTGKIRQMMSLLYSFLKYRYITGGKGEIKSLVLDRDTKF